MRWSLCLLDRRGVRSERRYIDLPAVAATDLSTAQYRTQKRGPGRT